MIDKAAALARMRQIEQSLAQMPIEVLQEAKRKMDIEKHNAEIDMQKARRRQMKMLRKLMKR